MYKKILCVGLFDNELNLLLKILLMEKFGVNAVQSAGTDKYAHQELAFLPTVKEIAKQLGFIICRDTVLQKQLNTKTAETGLIAITHAQTHITKIRDLSVFDLVITPYGNSYQKLLARHDCDPKKTHVIPNIKADAPILQAFEIVRMWVKKNL